MYELADERLRAAGYDWYEVSNWATSAATPSRHNLAYWTGQDWWGIGPGAHSHIGGVRWWNVKHPAAYASRLEAGESPAAGRETLDASTRRVEGVLLAHAPRRRVADGVTRRGREDGGCRVDRGRACRRGGGDLAARVVLTLRGRLLADAVVRRLLE